jgi:glycosyltransferase involved in cell wall biosynthesis
MPPFFSVIITTYNRCNFISIAITSVVKQTFHDWELIIIDDGSVDKTKDVVKPFLTDIRIKYYYQNNQERSIARNNGLEKAKGEYICFLDSDDYYLENHLATFRKYIEQQNFPQDVIFYSNRLIKQNDAYIKKPYLYQPSSIKNNNIVYFGLLESPANITTCIHCSFRKDVLFENAWLPYNEIYHFILQLILKDYNLFKIEKYTSVIVQHGKNTTASGIEFTKGRYEYITYFSHLLKIRNSMVRRTSAKLLLSMVFQNNKFVTKLKLIIQSFIVYPSIIVTRQFWGILRNILLSSWI